MGLEYAGILQDFTQVGPIGEHKLSIFQYTFSFVHITKSCNIDLLISTVTYLYMCNNKTFPKLYFSRFIPDPVRDVPQISVILYREATEIPTS